MAIVPASVGGGRRGVHAQFANLKEHLTVWCRDFQLLISRTPAYLHFIFHILVNNLCEHNTVGYLIQRDLQFVNVKVEAKAAIG